jgi:hypothetical protein
LLGGQLVALPAVPLFSHRADISLKVTGALGEATLNEGVYVPILDLLADHAPRSLGEMEAGLKHKGVNFAQLVQAVMVLGGAGHLAPVQADADTAAAADTTSAINRWLMDKAHGSNDISYLASPVTGGGITVGRFQQLFLLALAQGKKQPKDWAQAAWQTLESQGQRLVKEGKTLESAADNLAELTRQAEEFQAKTLPVLKALRVG